MADRFWAFFRRRKLALAGACVAVGAAAFGGGALVSALDLSHAGVRMTSLPGKPAVEVPPPPAPEGLQTRLEELAAGFKEPVGVAVTDVTGRWTAQVDGESLYPQQSVSKVWVSLAVMQAIDEGRLSLDQMVTMTTEDRSVFYQPLTNRLRRGPFDISIYELLTRAITESDNSANDKLIRVVGGPEVVDGVLEAKRIADVRVGGYERDLQARTAGLAWQPEYGLGWTFKQARSLLPDSVRDAAEANYLAEPGDGATPAGITRALARLQRGELLSPGSTQVLLNLMQETRTGPSRLKAGLPPGWNIGHKTGTGPDWRYGSVGINDVGLVTAPDGHVYAVAVMMRKTRAALSQRQRFMQAVSRAVAEHWQSEHGPMPPAQVATGGAAERPGV